LFGLAGGLLQPIICVASIVVWLYSFICVLYVMFNKISLVLLCAEHVFHKQRIALLLIGTAVFLRKCNDFGKRFSEQKQLSAV
jgi:hypothetical protein